MGTGSSSLHEVKSVSPAKINVITSYSIHYTKLYDCNRVIDLGPLNGTIFLYYWDIEKPLSFYINNANDEVGNHKLKASFIGDEQFKHPERRVFGTKFELQGDVASYNFV